IVPLLICTGIFITLGFRYRLVLLLGALAIIFYYHRQTKPSIPVLVAALFGLIVFMGVLNISRQYGAGLDTKKLSEGNTSDYYASGLREALIFQTSGAIIDIVPVRHPHAGFQPIWSTLIFPIP